MDLLFTFFFFFSILLFFVQTSVQYQNPVLWNDLADIDIIRVGDAFYYSASTMHYSPGAPILRSYDLFNWEYVGHSLPSLDFSSDAYNLNGNGQAYVKGVWASFLNYRASNNLFYWGGCIEFGKTYIYTSPAPEGPWEKLTTLDTCFYDAGLLVDDDDDTLYVAHGSGTIRVSQLSADGKTEVRNSAVYVSPDIYIEGSRFYKKDNYYYILVTRPPDAEFVLRSTSPWGPYEIRAMVDRAAAPIANGGGPHQGGIVNTAAGSSSSWHYMGFIDAYPGGRLPVLAPVVWTDDGWPTVTLNSSGGWGPTYPDPLPRSAVKPHTGTTRFTSALGHEWEWNHNPDNSAWSLLAAGGLRLATATVSAAGDLYAVRNTLTRRILGPKSTATIVLDYADLRAGDCAGLALLRDSSAWVGVRRDTAGTGTTVAMVNDITMGSGWNTDHLGTVVESANISAGGGGGGGGGGNSQVWLRVTADITVGAGSGLFEYSTDGSTWKVLGSKFVMKNEWQFFMGYRFAVFNYATVGLGGAVTVKEFSLVT